MQSSLALIFAIACCVGVALGGEVSTGYVGIFFIGISLICRSIEKLGEKK